MMIAARIAVATSLDVLIPKPTCPSESPMTTIALNRVRCPARVCFCTGLICESRERDKISFLGRYSWKMGGLRFKGKWELEEQLETWICTPPGLYSFRVFTSWRQTHPNPSQICSRLSYAPSSPRPSAWVRTNRQSDTL